MAPSSPRLPSPPPPAEDQLGPQSPLTGSPANRQTPQIEQTLLDANAKRRIHPGTKAQDMAAGPPLVPLNELDSAFQLQEHLAALHYHHTNSGTQPINRATAHQLANPPTSIDRTLWLYELCRFLISQCNGLIVGFLFDAPPCSATTCPEMRASEWQFLCAVHEQPKSCCAIDYCCHTLDWAANVVTDPKIFPSRFVVSSDAHIKGVAVKNLVNVFRRLHRIFAHAWFQHRAVFWSIEGQTGLYVFFKTVCDLYELLPAENYKLPPEAEGLETGAAMGASETAGGDGEGIKQAPPVTIAKAPSRQEEDSGSGPDDKYQSIGRTNTRRHIRASPSTGSAVTTVMETDEEDHDMASKLRDLTISAPETVEEESEVEVPVIVEKEIMTDAPPAEQDEEEAKVEEDVKEQDEGKKEADGRREDSADANVPGVSEQGAESEGGAGVEAVRESTAQNPEPEDVHIAPTPIAPAEASQESEAAPPTETIDDSSSLKEDEDAEKTMVSEHAAEKDDSSADEPASESAQKEQEKGLETAKDTSEGVQDDPATSSEGASPAAEPELQTDESTQ